MANALVNFLADSFVNIEDMQRLLYPYLRRAQNDAIVISAGARVEQAFQLAQYMLNDFPGMEIIFRKMPDDNAQEHFTPQQWVDSHLPWSAGGKLTLYCNNEPGTGGLEVQNQWMTDILNLVGSQAKVCIWNLQTHNMFSPALIDSTLRACARYQHRLGLHYYWGEGIPVDPIHLTVADYCQQQGIGAFPFYITEVGYCGTYVDGAGRVQLDPYKGYQGRLSSRDYADALVNLAMRYSRLKWFIYGWGGQSPWQEFDISHDTVLQDELVEYNQKASPIPMPIPPIPTEGGVQSILTAVPSVYVNVRNQPGFKSDGSTPVGVDLGDLLPGDVVTVYPQNHVYPGWVYQSPFAPIARPAGRQDAAAGWVWLSNGGVVFTPTGTPVPPDPVPPPSKFYLTEDQLQELRVLNDQIEERSNRIDEILKEVESAGSGGGF